MTLALAVMVTVLAMASLGVAVYAVIEAQKLFYRAKLTFQAIQERCEAIEAAQSALHHIPPSPLSAPFAAPRAIVPAVPRSGMDVAQRAQALQLHRRGASPDRIAAALELPRQEIDLLLKIHQIALNNL